MIQTSSRLGLFASLLLLLGACASVVPSGPDLTIPDGFDAQDLPLFDGDSGLELTWADLQVRISSADVIVVGEQHDDHFGHLFQQALVESVLAKYEGSAVSLEMLQRDEQSYVNDYIGGIIEQKEFLKRAPIGWRPGPSWMAWYQGVLESARIHKREVIAANAPMRYVRLAKTGGLEALGAIRGLSAANFSLSMTPSTGGYVERYREFFMGGHEADEDPAKNDFSAEELKVKEDALAASFLCQSLWDSTMAASIVDGHRRHGGKVVHLVGQFHSDFEGGLVQQVKLLDADIEVLVISMQPRAEETLNTEDKGRADVLVYTNYP